MEKTKKIPKPEKSPKARKAKKQRKKLISHGGGKKDIFDCIGLPSDVVISDPKIIMTDDYFLEFYNHKGIIDISETQIKINSKKCIYIIKGAELFILGMTDDEIDISGKIISIERE